MTGPDTAQRFVKYAVLTTQRSGSTWLMSSLNGLEGVAGFLELFLPHSPAKDPTWLVNPHPDSFYDWHRRAGGLRPLATRRYLRALPAQAPGAQAVGFKVMINQALRYYPEVLPLLRAQGYRLIVLTRDPLELAISRYFAQTTRVSHRAERGEIARVHIDPAWARRDIRRRRLEFRLARHAVGWLGFRAHWIDYADMKGDIEGTLQACAAFLGQAGARLADRSPMVKVVDAPYAEVVANYSDLLDIARQEYLEQPSV